MPSPQRRVIEQDRIRQLALQAFYRLWRLRPTGDAIGTRDFLLDTLPPVVQAFAEVAATSGAEYFEELTTLPADLAVPPSSDEIAVGIRARLAPLFGGSGDIEAATLVSQLVDYQTLQAGDQTVAQSAGRHGIRYAWVPTGGKTCPFCTIKASRGPVYYSANSAGANLRGRHSSCDCIATPVRDNRDMETLRQAGYNPDTYYAEYARARDATGTYDINRLVAEISRQRAAAQ